MKPFAIGSRSHGPAVYGICFLFAVVLSTGCLPLSHLRVDQPFGGLHAAVSETAASGGVLRVLVVHGIGSHDPHYSDDLVKGLQRRLRLHRVSNSEQTNSIVNDGLLFGYLRTLDFADGPRRLRVYEVTWSPITHWVKLGQFSYDQSFAPQRQILNGLLKESLLDDALSDAVLYSGQYRPNMQFPLKFAIKHLLDDGFGDNDQIAMITYSLGSYMTFDTLRALHSGPPSLQNLGIRAQQVEMFAEKTSHIYMLANQLPLLELTELSQPIAMPETPEATNRATVGKARLLLRSAAEENKAGSPLRDFIALRRSTLKRSDTRAATPAKLQIVAFSDPNDLLSFPLQSQNYTNNPSGMDVTAANVDLIIARWSYLGIVSNPLQAHDGWDKNCAGLDFIAFGGAIK